MHQIHVRICTLDSIHKLFVDETCTTLYCVYIEGMHVFDSDSDLRRMIKNDTKSITIVLM